MKPKRKKRWMPRKGQTYWSCDDFFRGDIRNYEWDNSDFDSAIREHFGVYKTEAEALEMLEAIKKFVAEKIGEV